MGKLNFSIHPLFFLFGLYFAFTGKVFSFIIYFLTALIHELGHFFASERLGYKLNKIVLMPYGAVISGDLDCLKYRDEIEIAFAGPFVNYAVTFFFVALWWLVPDIYPYTADVVAANLAIASVNLLPCFPLDGGRILSATLSLRFPRAVAEKIAKGVGVAFAVALFGLFVFSCFHTPNVTVLFFALFMLFGAVSKSDERRYIRLYAAMSQKIYERGAEIKKIAISATAPVKRLVSEVGTGVAEVAVMDSRGRVSYTLSFTEVRELLINANLYDPIDVAARANRLESHCPQGKPQKG